MEIFVKKLTSQYSHITFVASDRFYWSPKDMTIYYDIQRNKDDEQAVWALLHELGHAILNHIDYMSDLDLLQIEAAAWDKAKIISKDYDIKIPEDYIQDCLDTYRDWLHRRSACPRCDNISLQTTKSQYQCFNCTQKWKVSNSRFCRPYRIKSHN